LFAPQSPVSIGSGTVDVPVEVKLSGLQPEKTYEFTAVATNGETEAQDTVLKFRTQTLKAESTSPTAISGKKATLTGNVTTNLPGTTYRFEYDTVAYKEGEAPHGTSVPVTPAEMAAGSGFDATPVSQLLSGLAFGTTYHYRLRADAPGGYQAFGADQTFSTLPECKGPEGECVWSTATSPNPTPVTESAFDEVSCGSSSECVAIGYDRYRGKSFVGRRASGTWTVTLSLDAKATGISCVGTSCTVVGIKEGKPVYLSLKEGTNIFGGSTQALALPSGTLSSEIRSVSCSSSSACTAVGYYQPGSSEWKPLVLRKTESQWTQQTAATPEGNAEQAMLAVSCPSATSCIAVGMSGGKPAAQNWDGSKWSLIAPNNPSGSTEARLESVSCASTSCMAVGRYTDQSTGLPKSLAESWNGTAWTTRSTPAPSEAPKGYELSSVSCLSANSCFAVGRRNSAAEFGFSTESRTLGEVWNGSEWSLQSTANPSARKWSYLNGISCTSSVACQAVGGSNPTSRTGEGFTLAEEYR
jgi:hypothetical protein